MKYNVYYLIYVIDISNIYRLIIQIRLKYQYFSNTILNFNTGTFDIICFCRRRHFANVIINNDLYIFIEQNGLN